MLGRVSAMSSKLRWRLGLKSDGWHIQCARGNLGGGRTFSLSFTRDTALHRLAKDSPEAVFIAPASLAHQAKHALTGRR